MPNTTFEITLETGITFEVALATGITFEITFPDTGGGSGDSVKTITSVSLSAGTTTDVDTGSTDLPKGVISIRTSAGYEVIKSVDVVRYKLDTTYKIVIYSSEAISNLTIYYL
jgi:hypothetical protein